MKTPPKRRRLDDPEQSRLFVKKAREIGADEEDSAADALLGALHKKPHEPRTKRPRGRPVEYPMPEPIPDTPENVARAIMRAPPKKEWIT